MRYKQIFITMQNGKKYILKLEPNKELIPYIKHKYNFNNDFFVTNNSKIITNLNDVHNNDDLYIHYKLKGGFIDTLIKMLTHTMELFNNITRGINKIRDILFQIIESIPLLFNPAKLLSQIIYGTIEGFKHLLDSFLGIFKINKLKKNRKKKKRGFTFNFSFLKIIVLILCPPLAIFINGGLKAIIPIIICGLLTYYLYYIPGVIYAASHIY